MQPGENSTFDFRLPPAPGSRQPPEHGKQHHGECTDHQQAILPLLLGSQLLPYCWISVVAGASASLPAEEASPRLRPGVLVSPTVREKAENFVGPVPKGNGGSGEP